jgi:hypothetical protein
MTDVEKAMLIEVKKYDIYYCPFPPPNYKKWKK